MSQGSNDNPCSEISLEFQLPSWTSSVSSWEFKNGKTQKLEKFDLSKTVQDIFKSSVAGNLVSTVFIGVGEPIFETAVLSKRDVIIAHRTSNFEEAKKVHYQEVMRLRLTVWGFIKEGVTGMTFIEW